MTAPASDGTLRDRQRGVGTILGGPGFDRLSCLGAGGSETASRRGLRLWAAPWPDYTCARACARGMGKIDAGWAKRLGADHMLKLAELGRLSDTALARNTEVETCRAGLPSTFSSWAQPPSSPTPPPSPTGVACAFLRRCETVSGSSAATTR